MKDHSPFRLEELDVDGDVQYSFSLDTGDGFKEELFLTREDEGFEGNGYDWESIALVFLNEIAPELIECLEFDSEADMFCVYSDDYDRILDFADRFTEIVNDDDKLADLFSRAEII